MVKVVYYGQLVDLLGRDSDEQSEWVGVTISEWLEGVYQMCPQLKQLPLKFAINNQLVEPDAQLNDQDELSVLPPFAGG